MSLIDIQLRSASKKRASLRGSVRQYSGPTSEDSGLLAASITKEASRQTYHTIRHLVDRNRVDDAFRAYAYFRWVDDKIDTNQSSREARLQFLNRQQKIIARCKEGEAPTGISSEERMIADLLLANKSAESGLRIYIDEMMSVMTFDAERRGSVISQNELDKYTLSLATAVTEALHYFIGHEDYSPRDGSRYKAVTGAHITHMLRDALVDTVGGYFNVPREYLEQHDINPLDINHEAYRKWVKSQVMLARECFAEGREYLARVESWRCRMAGFAYTARFEIVLDAIEREDFQLRPSYPERKSAGNVFSMLLSAFRQTALTSMRADGSSIQELQHHVELN